MEVNEAKHYDLLTWYRGYYGSGPLKFTGLIHKNGYNDCITGTTWCPTHIANYFYFLKSIRNR